MQLAILLNHICVFEFTVEARPNHTVASPPLQTCGRSGRVPDDSASTVQTHISSSPQADFLQTTIGSTWGADFTKLHWHNYP